jgi:hypothetical protein
MKEFHYFALDIRKTTPNNKYIKNNKNCHDCDDWLSKVYRIPTKEYSIKTGYGHN